MLCLSVQFLIIGNVTSTNLSLDIVAASIIPFKISTSANAKPLISAVKTLALSITFWPITDNDKELERSSFLEDLMTGGNFESKYVEILLVNADDTLAIDVSLNSTTLFIPKIINDN